MNQNSTPEVTVIIVSFNTRDLTVRAIETLLANAGNVTMRVVVWDNDSHDGSADAVAQRFPDVELVRSAENVGFGLANNAVAETAESEWILLLNSDTETFPGAVENLLAFARQHPEAGVVGGRTLFADGTLNATSCFNRITVWSLFCKATGLSTAFSGSGLFNPEGIGGWQRDSVRQVDIITGCLLLMRTTLWRQLGGFQRRYFMYGEDNDLCLRAGKLGYRPMFTPDCEIIHLGSASAVQRESKLIQLLKGRCSIVWDHWGPFRRPIGLFLLASSVALRLAGAWAKSLAGRGQEDLRRWRAVWAARKDWLQGYR